MQGKLYPESKSIYEDEARIVFDYFSKVADKILEEEDSVKEEEIKIEDKLKFLRDKKRKGFFKWIFIILLFAIVTGALIYFNQDITLIYTSFGCMCFSVLGSIIFSCKQSKNLKLQTSALQEVKTKFSNIKRDYKIGKIGIAYVPVAKKIPFGNKSITVDLSKGVNEELFKLSSLKDGDKFERDVEAFKNDINTIPVVETGDGEDLDTADYSISMQEVPQYKYMKRIGNNIKAIISDISDVENIEVSLPVIDPLSSNMQFLKECGTTQPEDYPIIEVFNEGQIQPKIDLFYQLYNQKQKNSNTGSDEAVESFIKFLGGSCDILSKEKMNCITAILEYNNGIFANVLKSPYRNYSIKLEAETIENVKNMNFNFSDMADTYSPFKFKESSLMKFDLYSNSWVDETGGHTSVPFGLSQIQEEIFMPMIAALMEENRNERRKIYDKIDTEKRDFLNKWHTETQDFYGRNRDTSDALKSNILESLAKYNASYASYNSMKKTIEKMDSLQTLDAGSVEKEEGTDAAILTSSQIMNNRFEKLQTEFDEYMERLQDDIDQKAENFGHVKFFEAYLYGEEAHKTAIAIDDIKNIEGEKALLAKVSPYLAKYGSIPPKPALDDKLFDIVSKDLNDACFMEELDNSLEPLQEESSEKEDFSPKTDNINLSCDDYICESLEDCNEDSAIDGNIVNENISEESLEEDTNIDIDDRRD